MIPVERREPFLFLFLSTLTFIYVAIRSSTVPVTMDEAVTFLDHVFSERIHPFSETRLSHPNNHVLNSLLSWFSFNLFGSSELSIRLPNLLSFIPFVYWLYGFGEKIFSHSWVKWAFWITLLGSHYLIEFFAYARGYGLSISFLMGSLYYLYQYIHSDRPNTALFSGVVCISLALSANLSLLIYVFLWPVFALLFKKKPLDLFKWPLLLYPVIKSAVLLGLMYREKGQLYIGAQTLQHTLETWGELFSNLQFNIWYYCFLLIAVLSFFVPIFFIVKAIRTKITWPAKWSVLLLFSALVLAIVSMHFIMDVKYPIKRTSIHLYPLFIASIFILLDLLPPRLVKATVSLVFLVFSLPILSHSIVNINTQVSIEKEWASSQTPESFLSHIRHETDSLSYSSCIGTNWYPIKMSIAYHNAKNPHLPTLWINDYANSPTYSEKFQIVKEPWGDKLTEYYQLVENHQATGLSLFRRKKVEPTTLLNRDLRQNKSVAEYGFTELGKGAIYCDSSKVFQIDVEADISSPSYPFTGLLVCDIRDTADKIAKYEQIPFPYLHLFEKDKPKQISCSFVLDPINPAWEKYKVYIWNVDTNAFTVHQSSVTQYIISK